MTPWSRQCAFRFIRSIRAAYYMAQRLEPSAHLNNSLAKEARGQVYMATNILLLYGPRTRTKANVEKTRQKRKRLQVRMVAFEWKGAIQACREYNVERFIGNERE